MSLARKLSVIAVVYVIEGFPMGVHQLWDVFLRRHGVSRTEIGVLMGTLGFAWSLKFLWSPLVGRFGEHRRWMAGALLAMSGSLLALAAIEPEPHVTSLLWLAMAVYCLASATQDIAIDAYTIGLVDRGQEGPANGMRVIAYRVGQSGLARGLLLITPWIGWSGAFLLAAAISLAMAASALACPSVEVPAAERRHMWPALWRWLARPGVLPVAAFGSVERRTRCESRADRHRTIRHHEAGGGHNADPPHQGGRFRTNPRTVRHGPSLARLSFRVESGTDKEKAASRRLFRWMVDVTDRSRRRCCR